MVRKKKLLLLLLSLQVLIQVLLQDAQALIQLPNRHTVASMPGDLVMGILVPVHERPSTKQAQTRTCGAVREQYGIQRVEAAFRTIDSINADPNILPNITLGIEIRDSCWYSPIALEQSIEFIRDAMAASEQTQVKLPPSPHVPQQPSTALAPSQQQQQDATLLNATQNALMCAPYLRQQQLAQAKKVKNIVGVVGPASSTDTVQVQNLLQLFNMPQVGYSATSRDLSNKNFFKYFLRVVPSDKLQAQVLIDLMLAHNWTYITVAYTEGKCTHTIRCRCVDAEHRLAHADDISTTLHGCALSLRSSSSSLRSSRNAGSLHIMALATLQRALYIVCSSDTRTHAHKARRTRARRERHKCANLNTLRAQDNRVRARTGCPFDVIFLWLSGHFVAFSARAVAAFRVGKEEAEHRPLSERMRRRRPSARARRADHAGAYLASAPLCALTVGCKC